MIAAQFSSLADLWRAVLAARKSGNEQKVKELEAAYDEAVKCIEEKQAA